MELLVNIDDIPRDLAERAHAGMSMVPDKRAEQDRNDYVQHIRSVCESLSGLCKTDDDRELLLTEMERYRQGYRRRLLLVLSAQSRVMSPMITGPARFPVRSNEKRCSSFENRSRELIEWSKRAIGRISRLLRGPVSISSDAPDAVQQLQAKIDAATARQSLMIAANKIYRNTKLTADQKCAALVAAGLVKVEADGRLEPDFMNRVGFAQYELTNNRANIKRMMLRMAEIRRKMSDSTTEKTVGAVRVIDNVPENRLQLFFPGKPPMVIIDMLKKRGFHWSRYIGCWQRMRSNGAEWAAQQIIEAFNNDKPLPKPGLPRHEQAVAAGLCYCGVAGIDACDFCTGTRSIGIELQNRP